VVALTTSRASRVTRTFVTWDSRPAASWKTANNGTTFQPIFESYSSASIGDIAIAPSNPDIVWVGTGEANNRQSSTFGDGIYKSTDAGKTFTKMGLADSQSIARIVIDPKDPNIVLRGGDRPFVRTRTKNAASSKLRTGGKTGRTSKFIDDDTGFHRPRNGRADNKTLYAASYQRRRTSWGFNGGGQDREFGKPPMPGKTWTRIQGKGFPEGLLGRIGLDVHDRTRTSFMRQIEVRRRARAPAAKRQSPAAARSSPTPTPTPCASPAASPDARASRCRRKAGVWRSDDKGKTWHVVSNENNRPMYYSQIRVDPSNAENVYVGGLNFSKSTDGGKKFTSLQPGIAHSDHHAIWIDPKNGNHILIGNDGGLDITYDQGATWEFVNTIPAALFYAIAVDMRKPYYVCGGLQDNGSWCGPSQTRSGGGGFGGGGGGGAGITNADWFRTGGGDGFYSQVDPTDYNIIYSESQNGNMSRLDLRTGRSVNIRPRGTPRRGGGGGGGRGANPSASPSPGASPEAQDPQAALAAFAQQQGFGGFGGGQFAQSNVVPAPPAGEQYRFYWNTPLVLSPHNPRVLYVGGDRFFKSLESRGHLDGIGGSDEESRSQSTLNHGRERQ
jgi:hypothetical protein